MLCWVCLAGGQARDGYLICQSDLLRCNVLAKFWLAALGAYMAHSFVCCRSSVAVLETYADLNDWLVIGLLSMYIFHIADLETV